MLRARLAAQFRSNYKLHYTDCFTAALASQRKASLATTDKDFSHLERELDLLWTL